MKKGFLITSSSKEATTATDGLVSSKNDKNESINTFGQRRRNNQVALSDNNSSPPVTSSRNNTGRSNGVGTASWAKRGFLNNANKDGATANNNNSQKETRVDTKIDVKKEKSSSTIHWNKGFLNVKKAKTKTKGNVKGIHSSGKNGSVTAFTTSPVSIQAAPSSPSTITSPSVSSASSLLLSLETKLTTNDNEMNPNQDYIDTRTHDLASNLLIQEPEMKSMNGNRKTHNSKNHYCNEGMISSSKKPLIVEIVDDTSMPHDNGDHSNNTSIREAPIAKSMLMPISSSRLTSKSRSIEKSNETDFGSKDNGENILLPFDGIYNEPTIISENDDGQHNFYFHEVSSKRYDTPTSCATSTSTSTVFSPHSDKPAISSGTVINTKKHIHDDVTNSKDIEVSLEQDQNHHRVFDEDNMVSITKGLPMDLSLVLAKMKKQKKLSNRSKQNKSKEHEQEDEDQLILPVFITNFLQKYFSENKKEGKNMHDNNHDASSFCMKANLRFTWDSFMEDIAAYSKDTSNLIAKVMKTGSMSMKSSYQQLIMILPTHIHFSLILLDFCHYYGWRTLLNYMKGLTNDIITMTISNPQNDKSDKSSNSYSSQEFKDELNKKKVQLLGVYSLIKMYTSIGLLSLRQYYIQIEKRKYNDNESLGNRNENNSVAPMTNIQMIPSLNLIIDESLPIVLDIMKLHEKKRTVLASLGMDCAMYALEYISLMYKVEFPSKALDGIDDTIWKIMPVLRHMLMLKLDWNSSSFAKGDQSKKIKKQCRDKVLEDFLQAIDDAESYHNKCMASCLENDAVKATARKLIDELAGVILDENSDHSRQLCLGGIAESSLSHAYSKKESNFAVFIQMLQAATQLMSSTEKPPASVSSQDTYCLRSACSWISERRDIPQMLETDPKLIEQAVNLCFLLLKSKSRRTLELIHSILNVLWSNSNGIPLDVAQMKKHNASSEGIPESFLTIIRELNNSENSNDSSLDPSERVLSGMIKRCILHCQNVLLPVFIQKTKQSNHKAYVLISLLEHEDIINQNVCEEIELRLFDLLLSSKVLQKIMYNTPGIISHLQPSLIMNISCTLLKNDYSNDYVKSTISKILSYSIQKYAAKCSSEVVVAIIANLGREEDWQEESSVNILKYSEMWRKSLIQESLQDDNYSSFLKAICIELFDQPSNSAIFSLFSAMIGDGSYGGSDSHIIDQQHRKRISIATKTLISLCLNEYKRSKSLNRGNKRDLFSLIAPSLLLRRIPCTYYKMIYNDDENEALFKSLSDILASKLGIEKNTSFESAEKSQERKLLAELVPRCLPFAASAHGHGGNINGFRRFCHPIFCSALAKIKQNTMILSDWRRTKISLYICCHAIHLSIDNLDIKDYESMIAFAVNTFQLEVTNDENLVELQTGCIDVLATCLESICTIADVKHSKIALLENTSNKSTQLEIFHLFKETSFLIVQNGKPVTGASSFLGENACFSVATRTCVLNAFTMASKRCTQDKLIGLSNMIVTNMLAWALTGPIDNNLRHPLCLAAMMQCIFVLLTRSKCSSFLQTKGKSVESNLRDLFQLSIEALKVNENKSFDTYSISIIRVAAMKLLMGIINIDQMSSSSSKFGFLAPGDFSRALSIIRGAANVDEDPIVRKLAVSLTTVLQ